MNDALQFALLLGTESPTVWIKLPRNRRPIHWEEHVPWERKFCGHPSVGLLWERTLADILSQEDWEKAPSWKVLVFFDKLSSFLSVYVEDIKKWLDGKPRLAPM